MKLQRSLATLATLATFATFALCATAHAQFAGKPIALVVGSAPGSAPDVYARAVSEPLGRLLGTTVVVDNRTGANANIAAEYVVRAPADGHTLWVPAQSQLEINPSAYADLRWKSADFAAVIKGAEAPVLLVAHPSVPARTLGELTAWVKANPGKVSYASFSPGTLSHFLGYQLNEKLGLDMTHITYKGSGPQTQALLGGHVPIGFAQIQTTLAHVQGGKLNALAVSGAARWRQLPNVPTMAELGHPDFTSTTWFGLVARSATPPDLLNKLIDAAKRAHLEPAVKDKLEQMGFDVPAQTGADFAAAIKSGQERWARVVKATGFRASN
jgi:tripartite-type tricarboxylate transporter receptor subunit TctC